MYSGINFYSSQLTHSQYPELLAQIRMDQARETLAKQKAS